MASLWELVACSCRLRQGIAVWTGYARDTRPEPGVGSVLNVAKATTCHTQNNVAMYSPTTRSKGTGAKFKSVPYSFVGTVVPLADSTESGNDYVALSILGCQTALFSGDFDTAREMVDCAVALNPNSLRAWEQRGWTYVITGQPEEAIRSFARTIRLGGEPDQQLGFLLVRDRGLDGFRAGCRGSMGS
jgi:hypothetical protein